MGHDIETSKQQAALRAVQEVRSGMVLGLGHGSTAVHALRGVADRLRSGELQDILGVPCSKAVASQAQGLGIPLTDLETHPVLDLTIDGADQADGRLRLIKGGGGALLREKIVAQASKREIIVVDQSKMTQRLGDGHPLPVEVLPFGWKTQADFLARLGGSWTLRSTETGEPFRSDQGNVILDWFPGPIEDPEELGRKLSARAGILEHGLFIGLASELIIAGPQGLRLLSAGRGLGSDS